jgi:dolichol-phosphate mannosyltransferase
MRPPSRGAGQIDVKIAVVVPTYNERGNIGRLIVQVLGALAHPNWQVKLLVVDDESPDGTATEVLDCAARLSGVSLLSGPRAGLGAAYVRGLDHVLKNDAPNIVIQMDADFSHAPADLPRLIAAIEDGADLAIGSRYLCGNRTPRDWGWRRRLLSWGGNLLARHWLGITGVRDCTAGFRAWRTATLKNTGYGDVNAQGYVFSVALLKSAYQSGADIREVPVHFPDRRIGVSKLGRREIFEFARWIARNRGPRTGRTQLATVTQPR